MQQPQSRYLAVDSLPWQPTRFPGVEMKVLWQDPDGEAYTGLFRMAPGARLPKHRHVGVEQTFVLEGSLVDDEGICTAGNFVSRQRRLGSLGPFAGRLPVDQHLSESE